mmetsp:Transcript_27353/g.68280  ORF Transcript_27353/g.68280 Transcript_27353/m.68280 type:complete len:90 (-) Transcript_27353:61-330(-)
MARNEYGRLRLVGSLRGIHPSPHPKKDAKMCASPSCGNMYTCDVHIQVCWLNHAWIKKETLAECHCDAMLEYHRHVSERASEKKKERTE